MITVSPLNERSSARYTATLKDETGAAVSAASLASLTLTLYDVDTDSIINGRNAQSVLNLNNVTIDNAGLLTWSILPADTAIITPASPIEYHRALFVATWGGGAKELSWEVTLPITNLSHLS